MPHIFDDCSIFKHIDLRELGTHLFFTQSKITDPISVSLYTIHANKLKFIFPLDCRFLHCCKCSASYLEKENTKIRSLSIQYNFQITYYTINYRKFKNFNSTHVKCNFIKSTFMI